MHNWLLILCLFVGCMRVVERAENIDILWCGQRPLKNGQRVDILIKREYPRWMQEHEGNTKITSIAADNDKLIIVWQHNYEENLGWT